MANAKHLMKLLQGVEAWNEWRQLHPEVEPDLSLANLSGSNLYRANFKEANLNHADLSHTDLIHSNLWGADLGGVKFSGADLSHADLSNANLSEAYLYRVNLGGARLKCAALVAANLSNSDLSNANFSGANLSDALLTNADLSETTLGGINFYRTNLSGARLIKPSLGDVKMDKAVTGGTVFADIDLREIKGLESIEHHGPSNITASTLRLSQGQIPELFLQGCGFRDWEIEATKLYRPDLSRNQIIESTYKLVELRSDPLIQFNSCFISYSSADEEFARQLYTNLQDSGVRCWFAPEDMKIGDRIRHRIDDSILLHDKLLIVLSKASVESQWIEQEVETAIEKEKVHGCDVLFPVRLDDTVMKVDKGWPAMIRRTRHIGDFSLWGDLYHYKRAFASLLDDLRVGV